MKSKSQKYYIVWHILLLYICVTPIQSHAIILPSDHTNTQVITKDNGAVLINIAPVLSTEKTGDISYNAFLDFNVFEPGVSLNNQTVDARTIINEVISNNSSRIEGKIEVLGPKAHVIVANPNGITVNGGSFVNTGGVALSTGKISIHDRQITPITTQQNAVLEVNGGNITIEGGGLSGLFTNLEIIAKEIFINGPIKNEQPLSSATTYLVAGSNRVEFDSSVSTVDLSNRWTEVNELASSEDCPNAVCVNITNLGSVESNKIEIALTEQGAGVNIDGIITASQNNIEISSNGDIIINNEVSASSHVVANTSGGIKLVSKNATITAENGGVLLEAANNIENNGGVVAGDVRIEDGEISEVFTNNSLGAVTLISAEKVINKSTSQKARAALFGKNDNVYIQADEGIDNLTGSITSGGGVLLISTNGDVQNLIQKESIANEGIIEQYKRKGSKILFRSQTVNGQQVNYGNLVVEGDAPVISANGDIFIQSKNLINQGGDIFSQASNIEINTTNLLNELEYTGTAYKETRCAWFCSKKTGSTIESYGGNIQAANNITVNTTNEVANNGGIIQAISGDITISGTQIVSGISKEATELVNIDRGAFHDNFVRLLRFDQGGSFIANMGRLEINASQPVILSGGEILANEQSINSGINVIRKKQKEPNAIPANKIGILGGLL